MDMKTNRKEAARLADLIRSIILEVNAVKIKGEQATLKRAAARLEGAVEDLEAAATN